MRRMVAFFLMTVFLAFAAAPASAQADHAVVTMFDRSGAAISELVDGNSIQLGIKLPSAVTAVSEVAFLLDGPASLVATCSLGAGSSACSSQVFPATGWFWDANGSSYAERTLHVTVDGQDLPASLAGSLTVRVRSRPVVMVHGFISSWQAWKAYLGPDGFLASIGLQGFAVGDGQEPGVLNTGDPGNPAGRTNSIAQNAEILGQYIAAVQKRTGAEKVDLLVHSMGGMISRFYLDRVMKTENVAQVIFLATPMSGSACVIPVASLGFLTPASQEILPYYMINVFNQQIVHRHGVPFHMVAGTLLIEPLASPCAAAPSDTVVALGSAESISLDDRQEVSMFHGDFTTDRQVFEQNVRHLLQSPPGSFAPRPDPVASSVSTQPEQFSRVYSGHIPAGGSAQVTINIDPNVSLANFSLYDSSRSLDAEVRGASGNVIALDVAKNGLIKITDPQTMLYLGYGFKSPKPGKWVITLKASAETPAQGADYALTARFIGGATLTASSSATILTPGQALTLTARLQADGANLTVDSAQALLRKPDGTLETLTLSAQDNAYGVDIQPQNSGLYTVEVTLSGQNADGFGVDRAAFLAFEVQPDSAEVQAARLIALGIVLLLVLLLLFLLFRRLRLRRLKSH